VRVFKQNTFTIVFLQLLVILILNIFVMFNVLEMPSDKNKLNWFICLDYGCTGFKLNFC